VSVDSRFAEDGAGRDRVPVDERSSSGGELLRLPVCVNGAELASVRSLRGAAVDLAGRQVGTLTDIVLRANGDVTRIVVKGESGELRRLRANHVRIRQSKATQG
jgi:sporulation protein YlmC with PRC-barrel domain